MLQKEHFDINDFKFQIKKGQTFVDSNNNVFYYVSYRQCDGKIEIKPIDHVYKTKNGKKIQMTKPINQFFANFKICDFDILGNKYERKDI